MREYDVIVHAVKLRILKGKKVQSNDSIEFITTNSAAIDVNSSKMTFQQSTHKLGEQFKLVYGIEQTCIKIR